MTKKYQYNKAMLIMLREYCIKRKITNKNDLIESLKNKGTSDTLINWVYHCIKFKNEK